MKAIAYSLFGYERGRHKDCFDFNSYLRHLMINLRLNRLLYKEWQVVLETDEATYQGWRSLFERLNDKIVIEINPNGTPLTKAMLWRLKPIYHKDQADRWRYTHVLCRDLDSPPTYRERQAVETWVKNDKAAHAITDSVSHNIPMLGGMVGFRPDYFTERTSTQNWDSLFNGVSIDFSVKGADQTFLMNHIYPKLAKPGSDSITQHYFKGMGNTFLGDYHTCLCDSIAGHKDNCPENTKLEIPEELKETNSIAGHIGAAGFYETALFKFLRNYNFEDLEKMERSHKDIFYWA